MKNLSKEREARATATGASALITYTYSFYAVIITHHNLYYN